MTAKQLHIPTPLTADSSHELALVRLAAQLDLHKGADDAAP